MSESKTNALRAVEKAGINVETSTYDISDGAIDGISVAKKIGKEVNEVFKTLVTRGAKGDCYVFEVPVAMELDLKKAAKTVGEKSVEMLRQTELLPLTGYVHGGCSPIGMKKKFRTVIDASAENLGRMTISAGRKGLQMTLSPSELAKICSAEFADITK